MTKPSNLSKSKKKTKQPSLTFVDLFAGIGGIRLGVEQACTNARLQPRCLLTCEINPFAQKTYQANFGHKWIHP
ncbi:MAG: DNA cytosine methyltransferase, partial [Vampirovibrionales bacterium]